MLPGRIDRATRTLTAPDGWNSDCDGPCGSLAIRDEPYCGLASMVSAWRPSPAEILALIAGEPIYLRVIGMEHPAVSLSVGEVKVGAVV